MRIVLLAALLSVTLFGNATNYYFSSGDGDDTRSVQEAQNPATPWKSLQKLTAVSAFLQPGDTVFFKRGDVFEGKIVLSKSGTAADPIVFAAYGDGNKPVISGLATLRSLAQYKGNIWVQSLSSSRPAILLLNGNQQPYGRYPNGSDADGGFLNVDSHSGTTSITSKDLSGGNKWEGAELVIRKNRWIIDRCPITDQKGKTLVFTNTSQYEATDNFGFFIQNHIGTLDTDGEWSYDASQKKLYLFKTNYTPSTDVKASVVDTLFYINNQSFISLQDLHFKGANENLLLVTNSRKISIANCNFSYAGLNAALFNYATDVTIENSAFESNNNNAITTVLGCRNFRIRNNAFNNTGAFPGMGKSGDLGYQAITIKGRNNVVEYNKIQNTGYIPIRFEGDTVIIRNNFISNFAFIKDDGAGIYTWNNDARAPDNYYRIVKDNIIVKGVGAGAGTNRPAELHAHGIYLDDNAANVEITGNTVADCAEAGLYIHNARNTVARDNVVFNNDRQVWIQHDNTSPNSPVRNFQLKNNVLFAKTATQQVLRIRSIKDDISSFGDADSNYYSRPFNPEPFNYTAYTRNFNEFVQVYDLASWQGAFQKDLNSKPAAVQLPKYKNNGVLGANRVTNSTFDNNIYTAYGYYYAGSFNMEWNSGGKLDGGSLQATFDMSTSNRGYIIMDLGNVTAGKTYVLKFSLISQSKNKSLGLFLRKTASPYNRISDYNYCKVSNKRTENEFLFVPTETVSGASIVFDISDQNTLWIDNVKFQEANVSVPNPDDYIRFEYNASTSSKTVPLDGTYIDARGRTYSGSVTLSPFRSLVLQKSQASGKKDQSISFSPVDDKAYGDSDFSLAATATSGLDVAYRVVSGPATVTTNKVTITGTGKVVIEASQAGNTEYNAAAPVTQSFSVDKAKQTVSFADISNKAYGDSPFELNATASSGLPVSYRVVSGPAMLSAETVSVTGTGTVVIEASQSGNDNFNAATPATQSFRVLKASQTITFTTPGGKTISTAPFELTATASSGLPVSFRIVSGAATIVGNLLTINGAGDVTVEASQLGNNNYSAAAAVLRSFAITDNAVAKADQAITFASLPNRNVGDAPFLLAAFSSSGLPVSYRIVSGPAVLNNLNTVVITGAGTVIIEASQTGDDSYVAAAPVWQSFVVTPPSNGKLNQFISFGTMPYQTFNSPPFTVSATASSGLPVSFRVVSGPIAISNDNTVTLTGIGFAVIEADQDGNDQYNGAQPVQRRFYVGKGSQSINFPTLLNRTLDEKSFVLNATASSGLPVAYRILSGPATVTGNLVTFTAAGVVVVEASQPGDAFYNASYVLIRSFVVTAGTQTKASQTINFPAIDNKTFGDGLFALNATASSGLPVSYRVVSGPATVANNLVTITGAGAVTIEASQAGDGLTNPADEVTRSFTVAKASQAINIGTLPYQVYSPQPITLAATSTSGLPVVFRVVSGPLTVDGNSATMSGVGFVIVEASQPGDNNYNAAQSVLRGFAVGKAPQFLSFTLPVIKAVDDKPFALNAVSSSGLPVSYRVVSGPATLNDNVISFTGTGLVLIEASQSGDASFLPAFPLQRSMIVTASGNNSLTVSANDSDSTISIPPTEVTMQVKKESPVVRDMETTVGIYPNPVLTTASIKITVAETGEGSVEIFDAGGRLVKRLPQQSFEKGRTITLPLQAAEMQPGIYFLRFNCSGKIITKRFFVAR